MNEIIETYHVNLQEFNFNGVGKDGRSMREVVGEYERDFHSLHKEYYALFMYANSNTMRVLAQACGAPEYSRSGMDLNNGRTFDPIEDPLINSKIDIYSKYVTVYGIDSAFMDKFEDNGYPVIDEENEIYPLTLLIDSSLPDGTIKLSHHDDDDDDEEEDLVPEKPKYEFLING